MEAMKEKIKAVVHGVIGFVVLSSMILASLWLKERVMTRETLTLELAPDDIMMQLAQSKSYEIKCDKEGECSFGLKR